MATTVEVRGESTERLQAAAESYPRASKVTMRDGAVLVQLHDDDPASLNRWLAEHGVFAAYLAPQRLSLEDAFIDLTRDDVDDPSRAALQATAGAA